MSVFFAPVLPSETVSTRFFNPRFQRFVNAAFVGAQSAAPRVQDDDKAWTVSLDVPGVAREDLEINVEGAIVRIQTRQEASRQYKAAYELPQDIDVEATTARLENGVLTLTLAKQQPASRARQIPVA
ncbi:Hsp20/alpha crystallin family protein [Ramlibacter sp. AN1015]|uniref:Hsp20/alpha crystallin family protein n=1 Tax=Ramlibacter sp. AN1015 TaxID=3133428 RepID=UPI0030BB0E0D